MLLFIPRSLCALKRVAAKVEHAKFGATQDRGRGARLSGSFAIAPFNSLRHSRVALGESSFRLFLIFLRKSWRRARRVECGFVCAAPLALPQDQGGQLVEDVMASRNRFIFCAMPRTTDDGGRSASRGRV